MISRTTIIYKGNLREDNKWCFIITLVKTTQEQQIIFQYRSVKTTKEQHIIYHYHPTRTMKGKQGYIIILPSQDKKGTTYDFSFITPVRTTNDVSFSPQSRQQGTLYAVSLIPQPGQWRDNTDFIIITQSRQRKDNKHFIIITQSGQQRDNTWCIIITPVRTTRKNKCCLIITTVRIRYIQNNDYGNRLWLINISFKTTRGQQIMVYYHGSQVNDGATNYVSL